MDAARVAALAVVTLAAVSDLRTRRIPNLLTFGSAAAAVVFQTVVGGLHGLTGGILGWLTGIALFLPFFLLGGMGAGDVKLLGAVGAWLGPVGALWVSLYSIFAGGVLALCVGTIHGYTGQALKNVWALLGFWRTVGLRPMAGVTLGDVKGPRLAYAVAIAAGVVAVILFK